jgi:hypothetical protein
MSNRAIGALIILGCFKIAQKSEVNGYCGNQLQPGGEGSIQYINEYLPTQILDPQQLMQISIDAQRGFGNGWTFDQMGIGEDGLPVFEMTPPPSFDGVPINLDENSKNSIKTFWLNFKNVWCFMKNIFSNLSPWAQFQAALMALGALKTAGQVIGAFSSAVSTISVTVNSVFEWWRSTGSDQRNTEVIKTIITTKGEKNFASAITEYKNSGGDTSAFKKFCDDNKDFVKMNVNLNQLYLTYPGGYTFQESLVTNSPTGSSSYYSFNPFGTEQQYQQPQNQQPQNQQQQYQQYQQRLPNTALTSSRYDDTVERSNYIPPAIASRYTSKNNGGKKTKRRKQSKRKTKRRKTYNKRRRSSSRKR